MEKSGKAVSTVIRLGAVVVLLILLIAVLIITYAYVGNGQQNFYVLYGNKAVASETKGVVFEKDITYVYNCGTVTGQAVAYDVRVYVNVNSVENFDFSVDDYKKNFKTDFAVYDCTKLFDIKKYDKYFSITVTREISLLELIQAKYPDKEIAGVPDMILQSENSFILTITDGAEGTKTQIYFC